MEKQVVQVPVALLLDPVHKATTKVVWMALRLNPAAGPGELEALTGLSRHTVLAGKSQVAAGHLATGGSRVKVPGALLADRSVSASAKVLFGLLQATPFFKGEEGRFTYTTLCTSTGLGRGKVRRAVTDLAEAGWVRITQKHQLSPVHFALSTPERTRVYATLRAIAERLKHGDRGQALMYEYLSLLIDSTQFSDTARPGFLVNPLTGKRLEFDRFYPPSVGFEFHGPQHFHETREFTREQVDSQRTRDLIKAGLCLYANVRLVLVTAKDLSLEAMAQKVSGCGLPLRNLAGLEPVIELLEEESWIYRVQAKVAQ